MYGFCKKVISTLSPYRIELSRNSLSNENYRAAMDSKNFNVQNIVENNIAYTERTYK